VAGGGIAGIAAALSGARHGLKVALIQDRPVLGGNNSSEIRVPLLGSHQNLRYPNAGAITRSLDSKISFRSGAKTPPDVLENRWQAVDAKREKMLRSEENITLFLEHRVIGAEVKDGRILSVVAQQTSTGVQKRIQGKWFADCTGDGCVGYHAGADFEMTLKQHLGSTNRWYFRNTGKAVTVPSYPWALNLTDKPFVSRKQGTDVRCFGGPFWESGCNRHPILEMERVRDTNFRAMYGAIDTLKNIDKRYPNHDLAWAAYVCGKRESRRLLGDVVLTREHLLDDRKFEDGCVSLSFPLDLHVPDERYQKGFEGEEFNTRCLFVHYPGYHNRNFYLPYRCLYSRSIDNLFMAGRDISVSHEGLGAVRVMRTCGIMGEVVGMAASICGNRNTTPRGVYENHLDELKKLIGEVREPEPRTDVKIGIGGKSRRTSDDDKKYDISELSDELKGLSTVTISRGAMRNPAPGFKFKISEDSEVYLAVHDRGGYTPPKDWKKTDMKLKWETKETDAVYVRSFKKGEVVVPWHSGTLGSYYGAPNMAFVKDGKVSKCGR